MVSIDILVSTLFPKITPRAYKRWIAHLDVNYKKRGYSIPREDKRKSIEQAIDVLDLCLDEQLLPKTRTQIYSEGNRVTQYKRDVLKEAFKKVKL